MLFTGKGDDGTTKTFGCDQRISKSSTIAEALGAVDEINALLGMVKLRGGQTAAIAELAWQELLADVQHDLFVVQAELAGAEKKMDKTRVEKLAGWVNAAEKELPPISSFFVSGGTELGALCDHARTVARRAERRVVEVAEQNKEHKEKDASTDLLAYMNRLSSLLYALARLANHQAGVPEEKPHY